MKVVTKPWGKEVWLELNEVYSYKRIYLNAGERTSLQYHNFKVETNYIISGQAEIWLENEEGVIDKIPMGPDEYYTVRPPKKHRVVAVTDLIIQEVSSPHVDDVIRVEDDTNRADGRIESEHKSFSKEMKEKIKNGIKDVRREMTNILERIEKLDENRVDNFDKIIELEIDYELLSQTINGR